MPNPQADILIPSVMGTGDNSMLIEEKFRNTVIETTVHKK